MTLSDSAAGCVVLQIAAGAVLEAGGKKEVEIRAATVHAVELIRARLAAVHLSLIHI